MSHVAMLDGNVLSSDVTYSCDGTRRWFLILYWTSFCLGLLMPLASLLDIGYILKLGYRTCISLLASKISVRLVVSFLSSSILLVA